DQDTIISQVRYEPGVPWASPPAANSGVSLQLIDPSQDTSRVNNWGAGGGWTFSSFTSRVTSTVLKIYPDSAGDVYLDDIMIVAGSVAGLGTNLVRNGGFEAPISNIWLFTPANPVASNSTTSTLYAHSGNSSLHLVFTAPGSSLGYFYQNISNIVTLSTNTLSFWYLPTTNLTNVLFTLGGVFTNNVNVRPVLSTPGAANSVAVTILHQRAVIEQLFPGQHLY
ncbi:MAG: hypothetical protein NTW03_06585, partial [Verrucomicrobia bacterium]|nr:hypothetical protein [Verrucomicrobiota bacterium]